MGYELWNHSKYLQHKVRNMVRRGWLLKTYNDNKMLRGKVQSAEKIINDELDILHPVGFVAHVKNDEKCEIMTTDIGGDTSRRAITMVMGDREQHPQPDEGEAWFYAPGDKKMFARMKMKKKQGGGQGGGGGGGGGRLAEDDGQDIQALAGGGGSGGQSRAQTKDYNRVEGFHWNSVDEKASGQNKSTFQGKYDKGQGYKSDGNFDIKAANTQFDAGKHVMKGTTYHGADTFTSGIEHAQDHMAGGGASVGSLPSARELRANGGGQGGSGDDGPPKDAPDGTQSMQASGQPGNISLKGMGAAMGMSSVASDGSGQKTGGGLMGQMDQMEQKQQQQAGDLEDIIRRLEKLEALHGEQVKVLPHHTP